eukprot:scaffold21131_cov134-Isochrysis_galbana.AAC.10
MTSHYISAEPNAGPARRGAKFEKWIKDRLVRKCGDLGLRLETQYRQRDGESIPDFVIYSAGGTKAVIIDAKAYHGTLGVGEIHKLRRDMTFLQQDEQVNVRFGIIYHYSDTKISGPAREAARGNQIKFISQETTHPYAIVEAVYKIFYAR